MTKADLWNLILLFKNINGITLISKTTKDERLRNKYLTLPHLDVPHISISP